MALSNPTKVKSTELWAEELASRSAWGYEWKSDCRAAVVKLGGLQISLSGDESSGTVRLQIQSCAMGGEHYEDVRKWLGRACDQAALILRGSGWIDVDVCPGPDPLDGRGLTWQFLISQGICGARLPSYLKHWQSFNSEEAKCFTVPACPAQPFTFGELGFTGVAYPSGEEGDIHFLSCAVWSISVNFSLSSVIGGQIREQKLREGDGHGQDIATRLDRACRSRRLSLRATGRAQGLAVRAGPGDGENFDHRKVWVQERLAFLAGQFAIDICSIAIMSNHLHVVVRNRPDIAGQWSDEEVARRWWNLFPGPRTTTTSRPNRRLIGHATDADAERRQRLSSIFLADAVGRRSNVSDCWTKRRCWRAACMWT